MAPDVEAVDAHRHIGTGAPQRIVRDQDVHILAEAIGWRAFRGVDHALSLHDRAAELAIAGPCAAPCGLGRSRSVPILQQPALNSVARLPGIGLRQAPVRSPDGDVAGAPLDQDVGPVGQGRQQQAGGDQRKTTKPQPPAPEADPEHAEAGDQRRSSRHGGHDAHGARQFGNPARRQQGQVDTPAHDLQRQPFEPQRHGRHSQERRGHHQEPNRQRGEQIAEQRVGRNAVEVVGAGQRRQQACDQGRDRRHGKRHERHAGEASGHPAPRRRCGPRALPSRPGLVEGHEADHRQEGHLEAGRQDRLRLEDEDRQGRERDVAHAEGGPVEDHGQRHDGEHEEGALRRHVSPGDQQVGEGDEERARRRPLLDRMAQRQRGKERQQRADEPEGRAADKAHVEPRDRQDVVESGGAKVLVDPLGDVGPLAIHQRRRDARLERRKRGRDSAADRGPHLLHARPP